MLEKLYKKYKKWLQFKQKPFFSKTQNFRDLSFIDIHFWSPFFEIVTEAGKKCFYFSSFYIRSNTSTWYSFKILSKQSCQ